METLVSEAEYKSDSFHNTEEHGPMWTLLNQMLHIIVLVYTLFGMIQFKVKFIRMVRLVRWVSLSMITLNWYISIKFALLATVFYFFNLELDSKKASPLQFNCSLGNYGARASLFANEHQLAPPGAATLGGLQAAAAAAAAGDRDGQLEPVAAAEAAVGSSSLAILLELVGGPFRLLGNRAALVYGFYSIAIYIMLALFPVEHYYFTIGFNYIRFVLNDQNCLRNCYARRQKHLERLNNWSRNMNSSVITLGMKRAANQRDLRSTYVYERYFDQLMARAFEGGDIDDNNNNELSSVAASCCRPRLLRQADERPPAGPQPAPQTYVPMFASRLVSSSNNSSSGSGSSSNGKANKLGLISSCLSMEKLNAPIRSLRHSVLSTNHSNEPSYSVKVANENLKKFKPFVRSESWFKISMVVYPIFIVYYFTLLMLVVGATQAFLINSLESLVELCLALPTATTKTTEHTFGARAAAAAPPPPSSSSSASVVFADWSLWDQLTFVEGQYSVFALSCASSFYCSYYFGTILELHIWIEEIMQQLNLCRIILEFIESKAPAVSLVHGCCCSSPSSDSRPAMQSMRGHTTTRAAAAAAGSRSSTSSTSSSSSSIGQPLELKPVLEGLFDYHDELRDSHLIGNNFNQFGGLNSIWDHCKFKLAPQSERLRKYELMAIRLATKKQTILRAAYINLNLFFDELNDTRLMTTIILRRTTQIAFGFALMVSITRSQFETNLIYLSILMASCLAILNLYLICAASINSSVNKLLPQIHALISASTIAGTDHDLLEFWLRHIQAYGMDKDAMSYKIYGYKVTWSTILNFNGAVSSAYLFTVY